MGGNLGFYKVCLFAFVMTSPYYNHGTLAARFILGKSQSVKQAFFSCLFVCFFFHSKRSNNEIIWAGGERKNEERINQLFLFVFFPVTPSLIINSFDLSFVFAQLCLLRFVPQTKNTTTTTTTTNAYQPHRLAMSLFPVFPKSGDSVDSFFWSI